MIKIKGLDHVVIRARDADAMVAFYRDVLGCAVERESSPASLIDVVSADGELGRMGGAAPGDEGHNMDHFCVRVEPFDEAAIRVHLARFGVEGSEPKTRYGAEGNGPSIYIEDPEGNTVELKGPPD